MKRVPKRQYSRIAIVVSALAIFAGVIFVTNTYFAGKAHADGARTSLSAPKVKREEEERAAHGLRAEMPALQTIANSSLVFEANEGQADSRIKFLARAAGAEMLLSD